MATCKDCLGYQICKTNRTLDYSNYLGCVNVECNCKLFIQSSISTDYISRSRLLRDPYFQEGQYPESPLLRMAIGEQPAVHVVPINYVLNNILKMTANTPVVTNGDKIRAMSDEEMARELLCFCPSDNAFEGLGGRLPYSGADGKYYATAEIAVAEGLKWLQLPAEVDDGKA